MLRRYRNRRTATLEVILSKSNYYANVRAVPFSTFFSCWGGGVGLLMVGGSRKKRNVCTCDAKKGSKRANLQIAKLVVDDVIFNRT